MDVELLKQVLTEVNAAHLEKKALNPECFGDRALFNKYVARLKDEGYVEALVQRDMTRPGGGIHAVVSRGLTDAGRELLSSLNSGGTNLIR